MLEMGSNSKLVCLGGHYSFLPRMGICLVHEGLKDLMCFPRWCPMSSVWTDHTLSHWPLAQEVYDRLRDVLDQTIFANVESFQADSFVMT